MLRDCLCCIILAVTFDHLLGVAWPVQGIYAIGSVGTHLGWHDTPLVLLQRGSIRHLVDLADNRRLLHHM